MDIVNVPSSVATATAGLSSGVGAPTGTDPANPSAGDIYVDESTGDIYTYDGMNWGKTGGAETGTGAPTGTDPANPAGGDIYVDESTGDVYTYNSTTNTWESQSDVVSTDTDNVIVEGTDGLAFLDAETIESALGLSSGVGAPTAMDPANPDAGDIYVDESTGDIYSYDGTEWTRQPEAQVSVGSGAPTGTDPANPAGGDIYVDESTGDVYTYNSTTNTWENQSSTLDGNTTHIVRADAITDVAPSAAEVVDPIEGDTAHVALDNDTVEYWSHDGTAWTKDYSVTANTRQYVARYTAASGDIDFDAPQAITELDNIDAYRNGVRIDFSQVDADTIKLDLGTLTGCYAGDEIRIVQLK